MDPVRGQRAPMKEVEEAAIKNKREGKPCKKQTSVNENSNTSKETSKYYKSRFEETREKESLLWAMCFTDARVDKTHALSDLKKL